MNKFNKIFRKSMAIPPGTDYSSCGSSPPTNSTSYMSGGSGNNSPRNIDNHNHNSGGYVGSGSMVNLTQGSNSGGGSSNNSGSAGSGSITTASSSLSINKSSPQLTHSNSIANINFQSGGGPSASNLYSQFTPLSCIDFDQLFLQYVQQPGESIKSYYLVHSILSKQSEQQTNNSVNHNNHNEQDKSSWQPFYKKNSNVLFLILTTKSIILLDSNTNPFTILKRISIGDIKEIIFETSDLGLFSIELHNTPTTTTPNILFFTVGCEKREIHELLNQSFDEILKEYYKNKQDIFILKKCNMLGTVDSSNKKEFKNQVNKVLDEISMYGFSAQDLWEGNTDLKFWASKIRDKMVLSNDERFVIEFILPPDNSSGVATVSSKRVFRVPNDISIKEITNFLCCKTQLQVVDSSIYTLATIKGKELDCNDILADYGLGSFFDNWQLVLVERGKTRKGGLYNLEVHFPDSPEYRGRYHRVLELDGYMSSSKLVNYIGNQMDIAKSHLYCIRLDIIVSGSGTSSSGGNNNSPSSSSLQMGGNSITQSNSTSSSNLSNSIILDDDDYLTTHGLGSKFLKCKLKLLPKKFPKPSKEKQKNVEVTQCIVNDMIELAWKQYNERKVERVSIMCNEIIESLIDVTVLECKRASTLSLRMASLGAIGRAAMYKILALKEQEELNYFKLDGQKVIVNEAKDLLNSLSPLSCPSGDINLDDVNKTTLLHRVAPPPPPPMLGFKEFQASKKRLPTSIDNHDNHSTGSSTSHKSNLNSITTNGVDMNQILNMRGKLKTIRKPDSTTDDQGNPTSTAAERNIVNFTLRNTKSITKPQNVPVTNEISLETNELMEKLKKRHAAAALDAEDLGDS